jgi:hypothetical protein
MLNDLDISKEFIEESKANLLQSMPKGRKSGPYTKSKKKLRRDEVYKLHFDHGYSARKISELMMIQRNTINRDLQWWDSKIVESSNTLDPEISIIVTIERLKVQRMRLREYLDKTDTIKDKLSIERLMFDIDSKILYTYHRLAESSRRLMELSTERLNDWMKENKKDTRFITFGDTIAVSLKSQEKMLRIIREDKKRGPNT